MKFLSFLTAQITVSFLTIVPYVLAQPGGGSGSSGSTNCLPNQLCNPLRFGSLTAVLLAIVDILLTLAVPVVIFFIVYAGFLYVTAQGNASKIQDANRALMYAIIGGVIVFGARVIGAVIQNTVGSITIP